MKTLFSLFIFCWSYQVLAYPWLLSQKTDSSQILLDTHGSYFIKQKDFSVFSGLSINYHNAMTDGDLGYSYSYFEKKHYFRLSELSVTFPFIGKDSTMSIGVKDNLWNEADRYWNYGFWQSRYLLDPLRPITMGMPGIHWRVPLHNKSHLLLTLSGLHLPDIVIRPELNNNQLFSNNPLFSQDYPERIQKLSPLFKLEDFFKPNISALLQIESSLVLLRLAGAWKTTNQAQIAVQVQEGAIKNPSAKKAVQFPIKKLDYFFPSQFLTSLEAKIQLLEKASLFASFLYEDPEQRNPTGWESMPFRPHFTFSVMAYLQETWQEHINTLLTMGYTKIKETDFSVSKRIRKGLFSQPTKKAQSLNPIITEFDLFDRTFDWKSAISASIEYQNKKIYKGLILRLRGFYALDNKFYQLAVEGYWYLSSHFRIYSSSDFFFRFSNKEIKNSSSAIKRYEDKDRILIGAQYVF